MTTERHCPRCGRELTAGSLEGLCPGCVAQELLLGEEEVRGQRPEIGGQKSEVTDPSPLARSFGDYELLEEIARGGMGVVYRARQKSLNRLVAVKMILGGGHAGPKFVQRFRAEAEAAANLHHPNIVAIHEVGEHEGQHFFSMDYVDGPDLERLTGRRPIPAEKAVRYAKAIAEAIHYAHGHGILHRDVKPSNVLVDSDDQVRITDFGLAKVLTSDTSLTLSGQLLGSPHFVPPEQASVKRGIVGPASDVYGIGSTLYYLLTGRPPFTAEELPDVLQQVLNTDPVSPRLLNPSVPRDLETISLKCLEKDPERRYSSAQELADDLGRWLRQEPILARPTSAWEHAVKWVKRKPAIAALIATVMVVMAIGFSTTLWYARDAREKLWQAYLDQARYRRVGGQPGRRFDSLDALAKAAAIRPSLELRNEAIACLALPDVMAQRRWRLDPPARSWAGVCFDATCERYVWAHPDGSLRICQVKNGRELFRLQTEATPTNAVLCLSPNGRFLAEKYAQPGATWLRVWDLSRRELMLAQRLSDRGSAVDFSPDNHQLAIGDAEGAVHFYDLLEGRESNAVNLLRPHDSLSFDPGGKRLAASDSQSTAVLILDLDTRRIAPPFEHPGYVGGIAWSRDGTLLACACFDQGIHLWKVDTGERTAVLRADSTHTTVGVAFNQGGDLMVSYGWDQMTRFWDPNLGQQLVSIPGEMVRIAFGADDRLLGFKVHNYQAGVWKVDPARECRRVGLAGPLVSAQFSPDGSLLATASRDGVRLWQVEGYRRLNHLPLEESRSVIFHPDGGSLITSGGAGVQRWPVQFDKQTVVLRIGPAEQLFPSTRECAVLSPDGQTLVAARLDNADLLVLDLKQPERRKPLTGHPMAASISISPDGYWLATGTWKGTGVKVWTTRTWQVVKELPVKGNAICLFSPDGQWLVTSSAEDYRFWKVGPWEPGSVIPSDLGGDTSGAMAFSPDGTVLALLHGTRVGVKLLAVPSGHELATLETGPPLCFSPDGSQLATAGKDWQSLLVWDLRLIRRQLAAMKLNWADEGRARTRGD